MPSDDLALLSRRERRRIALAIAALLAAALWVSFHFMQSAPPRRIVLASGPEFGIYHHYAQRYQKVLAREGVRVEERMTVGADDNLRLLLDAKSGVDVAFMQGGIAMFPAADNLVMLASLYYEPLWVFYRDTNTLSQINQLFGKRIAIGVAGSGTRALAGQLLAANGLTLSEGVGRANTDLVALGGNDALNALKAGEVDAALLVGGAQTPTIQRALHDPAIKLMSINRADAYPRRFPFITKLTLPPGTIDFGTNIPDREVETIGTKAMLAARYDFNPALINLLLDAAREIHNEQGYFEAAGEFPGIAPVDLRVSEHAVEHMRFGPSLLYRYLPFWAATYVEKAIILLLPLIVVAVPLVNLLPQFLRWRVRSRIYRWYGELTLMERDIATRKGALPVEKWLHDLDRIERAVGNTKTPAKFASEAYTLREHIGMVRQAVLDRAAAAPGDGQPTAVTAPTGA